MTTLGEYNAAVFWGSWMVGMFGWFKWIYIISCWVEGWTWIETIFFLSIAITRRQDWVFQRAGYRNRHSPWAVKACESKYFSLLTTPCFEGFHNQVHHRLLFLKELISDQPLIRLQILAIEQISQVNKEITLPNKLPKKILFLAHSHILYIAGYLILMISLATSISCPKLEVS